MPYHAGDRYLWVALVTSLVILTVGGIWYTGWSQERNNRKFCDVVGTTVDAYREAPPATEVGRNLQRKSEQLYRDLGCE